MSRKIAPAYVFEPSPRPALPVSGSDALFPVRRIFCVGRNYAAHAREMGGDPSREPPFFFAKPADAAVAVAPGSVADIPYPPRTENCHPEIELVAAIGRGGAGIEAARALEHVWGYAAGLDMTRRDLQFALRDKGRPWELGKGFDASAPLGALKPARAVPGIEDAAIWLTVNGEARQRSRTREMTWSVAEIIAHLSQYFRLAPGDLIFTGTPEGVGPVRRGDLLRAGIDGLDELAVRIV
ncbi:MAG TPA: fumarylacetoacetate hydrolase family protein [Candidatus Desulfobacillus sp.]|nr:fumarylacetoacetate hydrolase family protein [Candidatus Desulfobacillus sp.]